MPPGLADAVLAVLARARDVPAAEAAALALLAAPDDAVAEVQLDPPHGTLAPVIGFGATGTRALLAEAVPEAARWLDAVAPHASHWGAKLGPTRQLYARGRFDPPPAAAHPRTGELLAATGAACFSMLGIELGDAAITRHVGYVAVTRAEAATSLAVARGVTTDPGDLALLAPGGAWTHLSWDLATSVGPFKADVGPRQLADAIAIAARLGLDAAALAARLAALGLGDPSHVGLRAGVDPARALTLYFRITAS